MEAHQKFFQQARGTLDRINQRLISDAVEENLHFSAAVLQPESSSDQQQQAAQPIATQEFPSDYPPCRSNHSAIMAFREQIRRFKADILAQPVVLEQKPEFPARTDPGRQYYLDNDKSLQTSAGEIQQPLEQAKYHQTDHQWQNGVEFHVEDSAKPLYKMYAPCQAYGSGYLQQPPPQPPSTGKIDRLSQVYNKEAVASQEQHFPQTINQQLPLEQPNPLFAYENNVKDQEIMQLANNQQNLQNQRINSIISRREQTQDDIQRFQEQIERIQRGDLDKEENQGKQRLRISWNDPIEQDIIASSKSSIDQKIRNIKKARFSALQLSSVESPESEGISLESTIGIAGSDAGLRSELLRELEIPDGPMSNLLITDRVHELKTENACLKRQNDALVAKITEILTRFNPQ